MSFPFQKHREEIAGALAYSLAASLADPAMADLALPYNDITRFIMREQERMMDFLRPPMALASLGFDQIGWFAIGNAFHRAAPERREILIKAEAA